MQNFIAAKTHRMQFSKIDYSVSPIKEYRVSASKTPTKKEPLPQVYSSNIFAKNPCLAQARMQKMLTQQYKIKATNSIILETHEIEQDKDLSFKNYGIKFV